MKLNHVSMKFNFFIFLLFFSQLIADGAWPLNSFYIGRINNDSTITIIFDGVHFHHKERKFSNKIVSTYGMTQLNQTDALESWFMKNHFFNAENIKLNKTKNKFDLKLSNDNNSLNIYDYSHKNNKAWLISNDQQFEAIVPSKTGESQIIPFTIEDIYYYYRDDAFSAPFFYGKSNKLTDGLNEYELNKLVVCRVAGYVHNYMNNYYKTKPYPKINTETPDFILNKIDSLRENWLLDLNKNLRHPPKNIKIEVQPIDLNLKGNKKDYNYLVFLRYGEKMIYSKTYILNSNGEISSKLNDYYSGDLFKSIGLVRFKNANLFVGIKNVGDYTKGISIYIYGSDNEFHEIFFKMNITSLSNYLVHP